MAIGFADAGLFFFVRWLQSEGVINLGAAADIKELRVEEDMTGSLAGEQIDSPLAGLAGYRAQLPRLLPGSRIRTDDILCLTPG